MNTTTRKETSHDSAREWLLTCPSCQIDVIGYTEPGEASFLARIHNGLHHGHRPDAFAVPVDEPAALAVTGPGGGA